jgi:hypothetical protein
MMSQADLVKFAEVRPAAASANDFLLRARGLLAAWHAARSSRETADALR